MRGSGYASVGEDHDVGGLHEGGHFLADLEAQLVGALAGDERDHVVVADLQGHLGGCLALDHLGDRAGEPVAGAEPHLCSPFSSVNSPSCSASLAPGSFKSKPVSFWMRSRR